MTKKIALIAAALAFLVVAYQGYAMWLRVQQLQDVFVPPFNNVIGNPQGSVPIVEFVDYKCPYCPVLNERLMQAIAQDPQVRVTIRPVAWLDRESEDIARLYAASGKQGKDLIFHNAVMAAGGAKSYQDARGIAQEVGIDLARAETDMKDPAVDELLAKNLSYVRAFRFERLPALVINGIPFSPSSPDEIPSVNQLRIMIDDASGKRN